MPVSRRWGCAATALSWSSRSTALTRCTAPDAAGAPSGRRPKRRTRCRTYGLLAQRKRRASDANKLEVVMATTIKVNSVDRTVDVDGDTPLLWVLRDVLGMTGTKFGCGMALCGACTVHVDGAATRSCITLVV